MASDLTIASVDHLHVVVPFSPATDAHMRWWLPEWQVVQLCRVELQGGAVGWGETLPYYTWQTVADDVADLLVGSNAIELMWEDGLGAGVQMALFDAVGRHLGVPASVLLGERRRAVVPISWWAMDMPADAWVEQCRLAVAAGYTSIKLKARPWYDLVAALEAVDAATPDGFAVDIDFNATLGTVAGAARLLCRLEAIDSIAIVETPIPQHDTEGMVRLRRQMRLPIAAHYAEPAPLTPTSRTSADAVDGYVLSGGASRLRDWGAVCHAGARPFWLQLVGTGLTTSWMAHLAAVAAGPLWPAITCLNIYDETLVLEPLEVAGGFLTVPDNPGLGVTVDTDAVERLVSGGERLEPDRHLYRYRRPLAPDRYFDADKRTLRQIWFDGACPISEPGSTLEVVPQDDPAFAEARASAVSRGRTQ